MMHSLLSSAARQLEQLLVHKLIPLAQNGAPLVLFDAPPRSGQRVEFREQKTRKLVLPARKKSYPGTLYWPVERVNSIGVPVLGCVFEGEADYDVRNPPGQTGHSWIVPVRAGTFFVVQPGIPFTADKLAWERPDPQRAYARGAVIHLRHDGIIFRSYTVDKGNLWKHPSFFLHEPQAYLLGERLLQELHRPESTFDVICHHYILLIFYLMQRCIAEGRYAEGYATMESGAMRNGENEDEMPVELETVFADPVSLAQQYINEHLDDADLSAPQIAAHAGLSPRHLNRLFKEQQLPSLSHYLQHQRLSKAKLLLKNPAIPIERVAAYCGFRQRSHFSAWFNKQVQSSPSTYRAQWRDKS